MEENSVNVPFLKHGELSVKKVEKSGNDAMSGITIFPHYPRQRQRDG